MKSNEKEVSVAEATREMLEKKPFLKQVMDMDAINYRGLARHFKDDIEERTGREEVNLDSIVMAIRRFERDSHTPEGLMEIVEDVLQRSELMMKSDINYYTFPREKKIQQKVMKAHSEIETEGNDSLYILQSESEIVLIFDDKNAEKVEEFVDVDQAKNIAKNLDMVIVSSPEKMRKADGILSHMTERIITNGIGLVEMITTYTETVFIVKEEDSTELYNVLKELTS